MLYSGIDLHKRSLAIHTVDATGALVREAALPTKRPAVLAYFRSLPPAPHRAVVECIGSWYWLRDLLVPVGIDLVLGHAKYLKAISYAKVKTDRVDARTLAQLLRADLIPQAHMISPELRETRDLLRARLELVRRAVRCRHSVGALLMKYNVGTSRELLALPRLQAELHEEQEGLLVTQRRRVEATLRARLQLEPAMQRLLAVPGIGQLTAATLVLELDDARRFPTVRKFYSYCRLVPGSDNSGGTVRVKRSKDGNPYLKMAFHHAAVRAVQYYPEIRRQYQQLVRRKGRRIAKALIAKQLGTIVYAMLTTGEAFNGRFHGDVVRRKKRIPRPME